MNRTDQEIQAYSRAHNLAEVEIDIVGTNPQHVAFPKSLFVHMSDACNIDCVYCGRQVHDRVQNGLMSFDLFEREISPYLHLVDIVQLYGTGEPMLHPDFMRMVALCKERGTQVMTTSNGTLLTQERAEQLVSLGLTQIVFSMDGCTQDTFGKLRGGADLEKIKTNIRRLAEAKQRQGVERPYIEVACVVSRTNVHQLSGMVRMTRELGGGRLKLYNVVIHRPEHAHEDVSTTWRFKWGMDRARKLAERMGVIFEFTYQNPFPETDRILHEPGQGVAKRCFYAASSPVVGKTGEVYPCCLSHFSYGKLGRDGSLWEILNSERAVAFRDSFLTGDYDPGCAKCGLMEDLDEGALTAQFNRAAEKIASTAELTEAERLSLETRLAAERRRLAELVSQAQPSRRHAVAG